MSWEDGSGRHEGDVFCVFADGAMGAGWGAGRIRVIRDRDNQPLTTRRRGWRSRAAIVGWRVGCDCVPMHVAVEPFGPPRNRIERLHWMADVVWCRVSDSQDEDLSGFRIFAVNKSAGMITERDDVHALAYAVWAEHVATSSRPTPIVLADGHALRWERPRTSSLVGSAAFGAGRRSSG